MRRTILSHTVVAALFGVAVLHATPEAQAALPRTLTNQGRLYDPAGQPVAGALSVTFAVYESDSGGVPLWSEVQSVTFDAGYFAVELGSIVPFGTGVFDGSVRYLGIAVDGGAEMSPRAPIRSVPYALRAALADDVEGDIHPRSVVVGGQTIIDAQGKWVGSAVGLVGAQGAPGDSVVATSLEVGDANCPPGGAAFTVGGKTTYACNGATGNASVVGPQGPVGPQGSQGLQGAPGESVVTESLNVGHASCANGGAAFTVGTTTTYACNGAAGDAGAAGPRGLPGVQGGQGPAGDSVIAATLALGDPACPYGGASFTVAGKTEYACNGAPGTIGATGAPGSQGPQGPQGPQGSTGATGPTGAEGQVGATGPQGPQGTPGLTGGVGPIGPQGLQGTAGESVVAASIDVGDANCVHGGAAFTVRGNTTYACNAAPGAVGATGPQGATGAAGPTGPTGATGPQGLEGVAGPVGPAGVAGPMGPQGPTGATGSTGAVGPVGPLGPTGATGPAGPQGLTGGVGATGPAGAGVVGGSPQSILVSA